MAKRKQQESAWPAVLTFGAIAGVVGAVIYANKAQAAPAQPPPVAQVPTMPALPAIPSLPTLPGPGTSTVNYTALVTDPTQVRVVQDEVAQLLAQGIPGLGATIAYGPSDVDGDPANPRWVNVLATLQRGLNLILPGLLLTGKTPPGFPAQVRTDGVLDQASAIAASDAYATAS